MISQWWPWRWMFWRRKTCSVDWCYRPVVWECVIATSPQSSGDALCDWHESGSNTRCGALEGHRLHVPLTPARRWRRVHFRIRVRWEECE